MVLTHSSPGFLLKHSSVHPHGKPPRMQASISSTLQTLSVVLGMSPHVLKSRSWEMARARLEPSSLCLQSLSHHLYAIQAPLLETAEFVGKVWAIEESKDGREALTGGEF